MNNEDAQSVINNLEGTIIADLQSLKIVALERELSDVMKDKLPGALNYSLFLTGLVACETVGYIISKDASNGDTTNCIKAFITSEYFQSPALNKSNYLKTLISLRTNLAHLYGATDFALKEEKKELVLCVGDVSYPPLMSDNKQVKFNGVKFIDLILEAFEALKNDVINGKSSVSKVIYEKSQI